MNSQIQSLLSKESVDREALTHSVLNIKPRFSKRLWRLTNISYRLILASIACLIFLGYYSTVHAQEEQKHQVSSAAFSQPVNLPHPGYLSTRFSAYHPGVDIAAGLGMPIHAITSGTVEEVNFGIFGYGNHIIISHNDGFKSMYAHIGKMYVIKGQAITTDTILGEIGLSGRTSGPHTHLELTHNGRYIDPLTILPELRNYPKPEDLTPIANAQPAVPSKPEVEPTTLSKSLTPNFQ